MDQAAERRREEELKIQQRDKEVAAKYVKLEAWKKELSDKIAKKLADANTAKVCLIYKITKFCLWFHTYVLPQVSQGNFIENSAVRFTS